MPGLAARRRSDIGRPVGSRLLVGALGAERGHPPARQQRAQLVLRGDAQHGDPGRGGRRVDCRRAQEARIGDLHPGAVAVAVVVARDPVARGAHPGDDRHVVGVGEGRHLRAGEGIGAAAVEHLAQSRHQGPLERVLDIGRIPAVGADRHHRPHGDPVVAPVGGERGSHRPDYTSGCRRPANSGGRGHRMFNICRGESTCIHKIRGTRRRCSTPTCASSAPASSDSPMPSRAGVAACGSLSLSATPRRGASVRNFGHAFVAAMADGESTSSARCAHGSVVGTRPARRAPGADRGYARDRGPRRGRVGRARGRSVATRAAAHGCSPPPRRRALRRCRPTASPVPCTPTLDLRVDPAHGCGRARRTSSRRTPERRSGGARRCTRSSPARPTAAGSTVRAPRMILCPGPDYGWLAPGLARWPEALSCARCRWCVWPRPAAAATPRRSPPV